MYTNKEFCQDLHIYSVTARRGLEELELDLYSMAKLVKFCKSYLKFTKLDFGENSTKWNDNRNILILVILSILLFMSIIFILCKSWKKSKTCLKNVENFFYGVVNHASQELPTLELQENGTHAQQNNETRIRSTSNRLNSGVQLSRNTPLEVMMDMVDQQNQDTQTIASNPEVELSENINNMPLAFLMDYIERENSSSRISSQNDSNPEHVLPSYDEVLALEEEPPSYKEAVNSGRPKSFWQTIIIKKKAKK